MNPYDKHDVYKQVEVSTCNRLKLVVMIYDAAVASLKQAKKWHDRNDIMKRDQFISRTQFIINELNSSLNMQKGQQIAETLRKLYYFLNRHLNCILSDNDIKKLDESLKILTNLREAWEDIAKKGDISSSEYDAAVYKQGSKNTVINYR